MIQTKEKNSEFNKIYWAFWGSRFGNFDSSFFREVFSGNANKVLPVTTSIRTRVAWNWERTIRVRLFLMPSNARGIRKHRVFLKCDKCFQLVPAGRISQHKC